METKRIRVGCLTWNCAGNPAPYDFDLSNIVLPQAHELRSTSGQEGPFSLFDSSARSPNSQEQQSELPHLYVVGLQEMVNLEVVGSVLCSKDLERMQRWQDLFVRGLNVRAHSSGFTYKCILKKVMFGCFIMLFARSDSFANRAFSGMRTLKVKTGVKGMAANKGSVAIRFNFEDTSFMFMNCHLTSGQKKWKERISDTKQNYKEITTFFESQESLPLIPGLHDSFKRT